MKRSLEVVRVHRRREVKAFVDLPFELYRRDRNWVAPLRSDLKRMLDPKKNPFFEHAESALFLATENGRTIGRISAHVDHNYNRFHSTERPDTTGFFGFFETIDDEDVAAALVAAAASWLVDRGMSTMVGPASFTLNDEAGLLVEGFDRPPMILMTYNPPYYERVLKAAHLEPVQDLYAYRLDADAEAPPEIRADAARADGRFTFRPLRLSDFDAEMDRFLAVYNDAWERNWGFVPVTEAELRDHADRLRQIIDPDLVIVAEEEGRPVAVALSLPDVNEVLIRARGRLGPISAARLLRKARKRSWEACRVFTLGVRKGYRRTGVGSHLYVDTLAAARKNGYRWGEMSWILESNTEMNRAIVRMGGERYKTYRMYARSL
jgi:GNAT superfamily N-acetyltransferase